MRKKLEEYICFLIKDVKKGQKDIPRHLVINKLMEILEEEE